MQILNVHRREFAASADEGRGNCSDSNGWHVLDLCQLRRWLMTRRVPATRALEIV